MAAVNDFLSSATHFGRLVFEGAVRICQPLSPARAIKWLVDVVLRLMVDVF
jgi:hypothetical protein